MGAHFPNKEGMNGTAQAVNKCVLVYGWITSSPPRTICTSVSPRASITISLVLPFSGMVHHLPGPNSYALTQTTLKITVCCRCTCPSVRFHCCCWFNTRKLAHSATHTHFLVLMCLFLVDLRMCSWRALRVRRIWQGCLGSRAVVYGSRVKKTRTRTRTRTRKRNTSLNIWQTHLKVWGIQPKHVFGCFFFFLKKSKFSAASFEQHWKIKPKSFEGFGFQLLFSSFRKMKKEELKTKC